MSEQSGNLLDLDMITPSAPYDSKLDDYEFTTKDQLSDAARADDITKILNELSSSTNEALQSKVFAEADSSTSQMINEKPAKNSTSSTSPDSNKCELGCPYYRLAYDYLHKIKLPSKVEEYILWKDPKLTGAVFGVSLVLLICLASFSFLSVISTVGMMTLTGFGAYRLYLAVIFRIKGTQDDSFEKWSAIKLSVPTKEMAHYCETHVNNLLNKAKSIVLWDNVTVSAIVFSVFYFIYCIGSVFNTLTLLILLHVSVFTLPKVYQVYQVPIDSALQKASNAIHQGVKQIMTKLPFLEKKKTQ